MDEKRKLELLAYAKVCFEKCTSPFASTHLIKKNVTASECRDLSYMIAEIIAEEINWKFNTSKAVTELIEAEKLFMETQET